MNSTVASTQELTDIAKLLSDETRVRILRTLEGTDGMCVYEIAEAVGASHSATSHQLAKLESRDVVVCYREGQKMCYELTNKTFAKKIINAIKILSS